MYVCPSACVCGWFYALINLWCPSGRDALGVDERGLMNEWVNCVCVCMHVWFCGCMIKYDG